MDEESLIKKDGQTTLRWQQIAMLQNYYDTNSPTFGNAKDSAIAVGYTPRTAAVIHHEGWFKVAGRYLKKAMLMKAERNLDEILDLDCKSKHYSTGEEVVNPNLLRIKADITKFVAERIGKDDYAEGKILINIDI